MKVTKFLVNVELASKLDCTNTTSVVKGGRQYAMFTVTVPYTGDSRVDSKVAEEVAIANFTSYLAVSSNPIGTYGPHEGNK